MASTYTSHNDLLLCALMDFYKTDNADGSFNPANNLDRMLKIITGESKISLRIIDWFVTNYAKKYYTIYNNNITRRFKVYDSYQRASSSYSKKRFDPFCRNERINIPYTNGRFIETTIGQLLFFKWAIENNVIEYIEQHYGDIERDMNTRNSTSRRKGVAASNDKGTRKKREELSVSATKSIKKEDVEIVVEFH